MSFSSSKDESNQEKLQNVNEEKNTISLANDLIASSNDQIDKIENDDQNTTSENEFYNSYKDENKFVESSKSRELQALTSIKLSELLLAKTQKIGDQDLGVEDFELCGIDEANDGDDEFDESLILDELCLEDEDSITKTHVKLENETERSLSSLTLKLDQSASLDNSSDEYIKS